jgi:sialidase-1
MYSDIAVTHNGTILCFYGRSGENKGSAAFAGGRLTLARFNLKWITAP